MADSDHQTDERGGRNLREKGDERKKGTKMNILYEKFWSVNLVDLAARSPMVDSDRQTGERGGRDFREKAEERKKEFLER